MSLQNTLFTGASGLGTYSSVISVISNNIANVNTPGFKESRANFSDILSQSSGSNGNSQIGRGVRLNSVDILFNQGSFQSTSVGSDLAIDGAGFFVLREPETGQLLYTRTGNFALDRDGNLVNSQGLIVQGFSLDTTSNALPFVENVNINNRAFPPQITSTAQINVNLNSEAEALTTAFDPLNPVTTSSFSTAINLFDSLGSNHIAEIYFQKTADNTWDWFVTARSNELAGGSGTDLETLASGELTFTDDGALDTIVTTADASGPLASPVQGADVSIDFANGAVAGQVISFNFGTPQRIYDSGTSAFIANPDAPTTFDGTTQFAAPSSTLFQSQDGFGSGVLQSFTVDQQGVVRGLFSNGQTLDLTQVALARFPSTSGLNLIGENLFGQSPNSGEPVVSGPGSSGLGVIVSSSLEISNVDLSSQFVELIRAQQAFQANSRVITTGDELLTEVVNLVR